MKDIIKNYSLTLGYQLITLIIPFISIPYLSRVLGPTNLGIEAYTASLTAIYISLANAGTSIYSTRQVAFLKDNLLQLTKEVYNILLFRITLSLVAFVIFIFSTFNSEYVNIFIIQILLLIGSTFFDVTWYFIGKEKFKIIVLRNLVIKIVGFLLILIFVNNIDDLLIYILINALTILIPNLTLFLILVKELGIPKSEYFSFGSQEKLIVDIFPLFIMGIIIQIYMNIDKIIIERKNLIYDLGFYSQFIKSYSVFLAPITAVGTILMPRLSNSIKKKSEEYIINLSSNFIFILCVPIIFGLLSISNEFVSIFYGKIFAEYVDLFQIGLILIFTGSLSNIVVQQVVYPNKLEKMYNKALIFSSIIRVSIIVFLIDFIGIYAAVIGYIISEMLLMCVCIYKTRKLVNILNLLYNFNNFKILLSGLIMFLSITFLSGQSLFLNILLGIAIYTILLVLFRENLIVKVYIHVKEKK